MNVEIRNEAHLDIAEGVAFYDRQSYGAGDYFYQRIFDDIESLSETAGSHEAHFGYHRKIATRHPFLIYYRRIAALGLLLSRALSSDQADPLSLHQHAVALRVIGTCLHVRHATMSHECFEIFRNELRSIVADESRRQARLLFERRLADNLNVQFRHRFTKFAMHDVPAVPIDHRKQIEERASGINVRNVHMPVLAAFPVLADQAAARYAFRWPASAGGADKLVCGMCASD